MMELMSICRVCLSDEAHKDISELQDQQSTHTCPDIVLFCLNIKVEKDSKVSSKFCLKCYKKIIAFYKFKMLALKSDTYLKTVESNEHIKNEVFLRDDIKIEELSSCASEADDALVNIKLEPNAKDDDTDCQSDNELLSVIKNIKYEYISNEPLLDETKENKPAKRKTGKRGRPPKLTENGRRVCEECGKAVKNLREHLLMHQPEGTRKLYPCKKCDKLFKSYSARNKHNTIKHLGLKKCCPICNKAVVSVKAHTLIMHNSSSLKHECAPCGRRFISQSALEAHMSVHTKERPYACDKCDKKFRNNLILQQHRRQVHDKEKSHLCQFCSKSFFKKYHLQVHLRSHTKEKPYACAECGAAFGSSTVLNNHRSVHSAVKRFACTLCSMAFARQGYLRAHMISHTKEKKHPCKYCGVKFGRSDHRKRHEHTAHERHLITAP